MCFKNLPIEFDAHGRARLRDDSQGRPFAVQSPGADTVLDALAQGAHLREFDIDPVTRVAGALSFHTVIDLDRRRVVEARTEASLFRGYEVILRGRAPTDAIDISSRACGVCGGVHAVCAAMALEMTFGVVPPPLAVIARNLGEAAELVYDHTLHLFLLAGPDYSEVVVRRTDPALWEAAQRARAPGVEFHGVGSVGDIMRGLNPLHGALYLEALGITRSAREIASLMLGKYPHPSTIFPGGLGIAPSAEVFNAVLGRIVRLLDYAKKVAAIWNDLIEFFLAERPEYRRIGERPANLICTGIWDDPEAYDATFARASEWGERRLVTPGVIVGGELRTTSLADLNLGIEEFVDHAYYKRWEGDRFPTDPRGAPLSPFHPWNKQTVPDPTKRSWKDKYTWGTAPRWDRETMECGPLARHWVTAVAGKLQNEFIRAVSGGLEIDLPKGELPATTLRWRIPDRPNALERNRARAYHVAYCGMAGIHVPVEGLRARAARADGDVGAVHGGPGRRRRGDVGSGPRDAHPPRRRGRRADRQLPDRDPVDLDGVPARPLRCSGALRRGGPEHAAAGGAHPARGLHRDRHPESDPELRPLHAVHGPPACRRAGAAAGRHQLRVRAGGPSMSDRPPAVAQRIHEAAWPDMLANLQSAYAELAQAQFELERRSGEIEGARDLFQRVIESMSEALFLVDHTGHVIRTNPAAVALFGCRESDLLQQSFARVCGTDRIPATPWQLLERAPGGTLQDVDAEVATARGRVAVSASCDLVRDQRGKIIGLLLVMRDVTERAQAEAERAELLAREQAARADAERANRAKDEFLATLSHELRTPLSAILGWTRMLRTARLDEATVARALQTIERNAKLQAQLVEDLLDVSRIITGKLAIDVHVVELGSIIEAALEVVRPAAQAKGIRLDAALDPAAGLVSGDPNRLQQIVWNLLSNAIKFTPAAGRVAIRLERAGLHARITVTDTGQGLNPDFLPHVFERFRQADSSSTRAHGGLGLGLAIVRQLVELHGGTVGVASPGLGKGATFGVNLPLTGVAAPAGDAGPDVADERADPGVSLEGLRVLVVDDQEDARELVRLFLTTHGAEVTSAASVAEAMAALERAIPDVLVTDLAMPHEDGYALLRRVRALAHERGRPIPVLAVTAFAGVEDSRRVRAAGFAAHLAKPVEPQQIARAVALAVGRPWAAPDRRA
jgi:hydrogenase large subunit